MMRISRQIIFVLIELLFLFPLHTAAAKSPNSKRGITESEFLHLVKNDKTISNRTVPATAIIKALRWAQQASKRHEKLPDSVNLEDCLVEGPFSFYEGLEWFETPEKHENEFTTLLDQTAVDTLPPGLSQRFRESGIKNVMIIPVGLSFSSTQFKSRYTPNFTFLDTIFEGEVTFDSVDFGDAYVRFDNSIFTAQTLFQSCTFGSEVTFLSATFQDLADFDGSSFKSAATFDEVNFQDSAVFDSLVGAELRFEKIVSFRRALINKDMEFSSVSFGSELDFAEANLVGTVTFESCKVAGNAFFTGVNEATHERSGNLNVYDTTFYERAYFNNSRANELSFSGLTIEDEDSGQQTTSSRVSAPVIFHKRSAFTGLDCNRADFRQVEFQDYADFSDAHFAERVDFSNAIFEAGVSFYIASFPYSPSDGRDSAGSQAGVALAGVQFLKGVVLDWKQIDRSLRSENSDTLKRLENAFKETGDLESQNEVMYRRRSLENAHVGWWPQRIGQLDRVFWGYGVRPLRVLGWMLIVTVIFTAIYWTQTFPLMRGRYTVKSLWKRLVFTIAFSLRTSWAWGFGYNNARTISFKVIALVHSIGFKILLLFLLQAFANTSPLLNQLAGKLIHV